MDGSQSSQSYLVVAKNPEKGLQLGIRILVGSHHRHLVVGFRLRSARIPGEQGASPAEGWGFPWTKKDLNRASLVTMIAMERKHNEAQLLPGDLKAIRFAGKVYNFLAAQVTEEQWAIDQDAMADWIMARIGEEAAKFSQEAYDPAVKLAALEAKAVEFNTWYYKQMEELEAAIASMEQHDMPPIKGALVQEFVGEGAMYDAINTAAQLGGIKLGDVSEPALGTSDDDDSNEEGLEEDDGDD